MPVPIAGKLPLNPESFFQDVSVEECSDFCVDAGCTEYDYNELSKLCFLYNVSTLFTIFIFNYLFIFSNTNFFI